MNRELTYNKWIKYIHDYQLNKIKIMKKDINFWTELLKQALKSGDIMYAMHCDKMINKLKQLNK